jgi:hypothetical protein
MDDQRADREGGGSIVDRPRNLFRIRLRLLLLVITLFCVLCGYYRVRREMQRDKLRSQIVELQLRMEVLKAAIPRDLGSHDPEPELQLRDLFDEIGKKQQQLDDSHY